MSRFAFAQLLPPCTQVLVLAVANLKSYTRVFIWIIMINEQAIAPTIVWALLTGLASSRRRRSAGEEVKKNDEINIVCNIRKDGIWTMEDNISKVEHRP